LFNRTGSEGGGAGGRSTRLRENGLLGNRDDTNAGKTKRFEKPVYPRRWKLIKPAIGGNNRSKKAQRILREKKHRRRKKIGAVAELVRPSSSIS